MPHSPPTSQTLLDWLAGRYPTAKRQTLRRMVQAGRVTINGRAARNVKDPVATEDRVVVADRVAGEESPRAHRRGAERPALRVIYEDADLLVVDKPAGLLTSTVPREPRPTLLAMVRDHVSTNSPGRGRSHRVGLIHRLDRDASGLLVFTKTHEAYLSLKRQLFEHTVERVYTALVEGIPNPRSGRIETRLVERADGTVYSTRRVGEGERAVTEYEVLEERDGCAMVRVKLHTGRKHQIRVHLSERGTPIVGDEMYGGTKPGAKSRAAKAKAADRLMLAATRLSFTHPHTGERLTFERPVPKGFTGAVASKPSRKSR